MTLRSIWERNEAGEYGPWIKEVPASELPYGIDQAVYPSDVLYDSELKDNSSLFWVRLASYTDPEDRVTASLRELAAVMRVSTDTIRRMVRNLEEHGYLSVERRYKAKHTYQLLLHGERIEWPGGIKGYAAVA
ncbi:MULTISPECIES: helix-turn-helix domain-containing protein [unclassified Streptomyces]|uniref:helix-turn-helix domain-containing protein n=1 Tax=unclassified Streptomyces TaxID=2593676 RepID=UPI0033A8C9B8